MKRSLTMRLQWFRSFKPEWRQHRLLLLGLIGASAMLLLLGLASPLLFKLLVDRVMIGHELRLLLYICIGYILLYVAESAVKGGQLVAQNKLSNRLTFAVRRKVWARFVQMPFENYEQQNSGDLKSRIDQDVEAVDRLFKSHLLEYGYSIAFLISSAALMAWFSWKLTLFGLLMVPLSFWMTKWLGKGAKEAAENYRETFGRYEGWLQQSIRAWKEVKVGGMEKRSSLAFTEYWHELSGLFFKRHMYWYGNRSFQALKDFFITRMNLYFVGGLLIIHGDMTIGGLLVFMKYYEQCFTQLAKIMDLDMQFMDDLPSLEKVKNTLEETKADTRISELSMKPFFLPGAGTISFQDVSFRYGNATKSALQGITLHIEAGTKVAIVGRSGSGKSTLMKLLLGMYQPDAGRIVLDERDISTIRHHELHREIGVVMQDSNIFNMSVLENVRLARPMATDLEVTEACAAAQMDEFILKLPQQYETMIGERGVQLSGGQKQRLALARMMLSQSRIVILDEATSQLDQESENGINRTLDQLAGDRTVVIVAHRFSSVKQADRIVLLDDGLMLDEGSHEELWARNETYRSLFTYNRWESEAG
ncbi:hypothetical protein A8L34_15265 [Bacillus sp. FJAT-27264]|uniref:ABC transporter ATP-binding protein n=1 Tax=Paenibacillus sp. (strain DSM 101736 / FJAT-27264) TaxID=1850362 RepID=UPI000807F1E6|nr:ABC transporter ATP-binding protein [Bacillus sp. FJAT-27264]OBZ11701.1 hypothetical protein A8L34_15265 [Bacillus sp. FJAT-27264]